MKECDTSLPKEIIIKGLPQDFITFIKFIDQYPTIYLSIDIIEDQNIDYIEKIVNVN